MSKYMANMPSAGSTLPAHAEPVTAGSKTSATVERLSVDMLLFLAL